MQREFIEIEYEINFDSPFHFGTGLPNGLIDRGVARDAEGYLYIPGSTIKGVLRERCEQIAELFDLDDVSSPHDELAALANFNKVSIVDRIFGNRFSPGEVYFDNATMSDKWQDFFRPGKESQNDDDQDNNQDEDKHDDSKLMHLQTEARTQTSISRILGTVREGALFQSEFGVKELTFEGSIYGQLSGIPLAYGDGLYSTVLLIMALCSCKRVGANKSTGMGKCSIKVTSLKINDKEKQTEDFLKYLEDNLILYEDAREEVSA